MSARHRQEVGLWAVEVWNASQPVGAAVFVTLDDGSDRPSWTRSAAWCLGGGVPVVQVDGISGGFSLYRVRPRPGAPVVV